MDPEVIRKVEAVLFASGRFIDVTRITELLDENKKHVKQALDALRKSYAESGSALQVVEEDDAWKIHVVDDYLELVSKVISDTEVSGPVLETLAVIAWRSPVIQAEVVDIRGSNAYEHIKELVERGFVNKEPSGRSYQLRITEKFFDYFDIEGREDIRKVFMEVEEAHRKKEMDLELDQKRLAAAIDRAENGDVPVVDVPEDAPRIEKQKPAEPASEEKQEALPKRDVDLERLDEILEKSAKTRERIGEELSAMRTSEEHDDSEASDEDANVAEPEEDDKTLEETRQEAEKIRKKVEEDAENL